MRRNCDLELRLVTPSSVHSNGLNQTTDGDVNQDEKQNLTVFYNGKIAAWDVTELQARAIISLASSQETEARNNVVVRSITKSEEVTSPTVAINSQIYSPTSTALSMKKSLQRFLEKRKNRAQATSPYYYYKH